MWLNKRDTLAPKIARPSNNGRKNQTRSRSLQVERLEPRAMLAVITSISQGNLLVKGDGDYDNLAITGDLATGQITVTGFDDADGNPTLVDGVANGSVSYQVYGNLTIDNRNGTTRPSSFMTYAGDNLLTLDDVYISGTIKINWGGVNTKIELAHDAPVYAEGNITVNAFGLDRNEVVANNSTVYSLASINVNAAGTEGVINSSRIQANEIVSFTDDYNVTAEGDFNRPQGEDSSFTATITNVWSGSGIVIRDFAKVSNVSFTSSSSRTTIDLSNYFCTDSYWAVSFVYATTQLNILSNGYILRIPAVSDLNTTFYFTRTAAGGGNSNIAVAFCGAESMGINAWGYNGNTIVYSNNIFGDAGLTLTTPGFNGTPPAEMKNSFSMTYNVIAGKLDTGFGPGDETVVLIGNTVNGAAVLDGKEGTNKLTRLYNALPNVTVSNFIE